MKATRLLIAALSLAASAAIAADAPKEEGTPSTAPLRSNSNP